MSRPTGSLATECPVCYGLGVTPSTAPAMRLVEITDSDLHRARNPEGVALWPPRAAYVEVQTLQQGSGCPRCLGTGQLER